MPIYLPPISRRVFLGQAVAAAGVFAVSHVSASDPDGDPNTVALLADTHVPSDPQTTARGVNMTSNLRQIVAELTARRPKLSGVIVNGDCAYLKGLPADYETLAGAVRPLSEAGLPLHLTMGNHDDRGPLYEALADQRPTDPPVESKHVSVLQAPKANWFLLDSLFQVDVVTGELGDAQLERLARALDAHADKPAILVAHHNPQFEPSAGGGWSGLKDSKALFDLVAARKHVKAYIYGHTHDWRIRKSGDVHLVNLPPVAYVFQEGRPNGWVEATVRDDGLRLHLHCLDKAHAQHGETAELTWS